MEVLITNDDCHNRVELKCCPAFGLRECIVRRKSPYFAAASEASVTIFSLTVTITGLQEYTEYTATVTPIDDDKQPASVDFHAGNVVEHLTHDVI